MVIPCLLHYLFLFPPLQSKQFQKGPNSAPPNSRKTTTRRATFRACPVCFSRPISDSCGPRSWQNTTKDHFCSGDDGERRISVPTAGPTACGYRLRTTLVALFVNVLLEGSEHLRTVEHVSAGFCVRLNCGDTLLSPLFVSPPQPIETVARGATFRPPEFEENNHTTRNVPSLPGLCFSSNFRLLWTPRLTKHEETSLLSWPHDDD